MNETSRKALQRADARGQARLLSWTLDGTLIDGMALAAAWQLTPDELEEARRRGEVFAIGLEGKAWYSAQALKIERCVFALINRALGESSSTDKLLFLMHRHGALSGMTPAHALELDTPADVLRLAKLWSET